MPALEDAVDTSSFDPEAYLARRDAGTSSTDGFDPEAYLARREARTQPSQSVDNFDPEAYLARRTGKQIAAVAPDVAATAVAVSEAPQKPAQESLIPADILSADKARQEIINTGAPGVTERAKAFVEGAGIPTSVEGLKETGKFLIRSPVEDVKAIAQGVTELPAKIANLGETLANSPVAHVFQDPTSPESFGTYGTVIGMLFGPKAGEAVGKFIKGGEPNASKIASPESVPVPEVRGEVGGETPLRQQGETPTESIPTEIAQPQTATEPVAETPSFTPTDVANVPTEPIGEPGIVGALEQIRGETTPKPETAPVEAPAASGEPLGSGISNERLQEIYGDAAPVTTTGKGPAEWKNIGQTRLEDFQKAGKPENDPAVVLTNLREGKVPMSQVPHDVSLLRAEHQRLLESARKAEGTPEYEAKAQASLDMATAIKEVAHGPASDVFRALQEYDQPKYDNVTDFDQAVRERMGRETTPSEKVQFKKIADEVGKTRDIAGKEIEIAQKQLKRFRSREKMTFDDATKDIHKQFTELLKDCVL